MDVISVIAVVLFCIGAFVLLYGIWLIDNDRYEFKKKHGYDPKYHGWEVIEDDKNQDQ